MALTKRDTMSLVASISDPAALVIAERGRRHWSARDAAGAARSKGQAISNTLWSNFEAGRSGLTRTVRLGVAAAFTWPDDWPENPPALTPLSRTDELEDVRRRLDRIEALVDRLLAGEQYEGPPVSAVGA